MSKKKKNAGVAMLISVLKLDFRPKTVTRCRRALYHNERTVEQDLTVVNMHPTWEHLNI